jgi:hypothetical protein
MKRPTSIKDQTVRFSWTGTDSILKAEVKHGGKVFSLTFRNNRLTVDELIKSLEVLNAKLTEHASSTSGSEEIQREAGTEEEEGAAERSPSEDDSSGESSQG